MSAYLRILLISLLIISASNYYAQIKISSFKSPESVSIDSSFFDSNSKRKLILLDSGWKCYYETTPQNKISVSPPATFSGRNSLIYEKKVFFSSYQVNETQIVLGFLGINYNAEISINGLSIHKHNGGNYPIKIALPRDILKPDENNTISVKIFSKLNSENTFPVEQRFIFPNVGFGLLRMPYLKIVPSTHISYSSYKTRFENNYSKAIIDFNVGIGNSSFNKTTDENSSNLLSVKINLMTSSSSNIISKTETTFNLPATVEDYQTSLSLELPNPLLWTSENPNTYDYEISIFSNNQLVDKTLRKIAFHEFAFDSNGLKLNGQEFKIKAVTYYINENDLSKNNSFAEIQRNLALIKSTGFNAVRFAKSFPHPYALKMCRDLGMVSLVELPINSIPEEILGMTEFGLNSVQLIKKLINNYKEYSDVLILCAGSGFLPNSEINESFIGKVSAEIKTSGYISYASFSGVQFTEIPNLDLKGIEIYSTPISSIENAIGLDEESPIKYDYFFSEVNYPNYYGSSSGYMVKNSSEAQAKYYSDLIELALKNKISGFVINSFNNYTSPYKSLYAGAFKNGKSELGIVEDSKQLRSISLKVIESKLKNNPRITIPIGTSKSDNPILFILIALGLSILMAVLINTSKKFREDCTRALLRPYNFYADVRDHRILSSVHAFLLMFIEAGAASLLFTIVLYFLRANILFEKFLLSFGEPALLDKMVFLSWNPEKSFFILFIVIVLKFFVLSLLIKLGSLFIKTKVEYLSILYTLIWAALPFTLLLPIELLLFKALSSSGMTLYALGAIVLFFLWLAQRILKGIYVIFDVPAIRVYAYSILLIVLLVGSIVIKYQLTDSFIYYITNSFKQYSTMIL
jgi:beta-galactosidase